MAVKAHNEVVASFHGLARAAHKNKAACLFKILEQGQTNCQNGDIALVYTLGEFFTQFQTNKVLVVTSAQTQKTLVNFVVPGLFDVLVNAHVLIEAEQAQLPGSWGVQAGRGTDPNTHAMSFTDFLANVQPFPGMHTNSWAKIAADSVEP